MDNIRHSLCLSFAAFLFGIICAASACNNIQTTKKLYRVLRDDEDCNVGLLAKDPTEQKTLVSHIAEGSSRGYTSQFISMTSDLDKTDKINNLKKNKSPVVVVNLADLKQHCTIYDLTTQKQRDALLPNNNDGKKAKAYAAAWCEVVVACGSTRIPCAKI